MSDQRPAPRPQSRSAAGDRSPWLIAIVVSIATFMVVLDTAIANVSLRYIAGSLAVSVDESTWVVTTYLIANAVVLPISGWLSNVIGRKRFYMICVAVFTVASLLCGLASSLTALIVFRILQGLGGGGMPTSEQAMLADTFPPQQRPQAFAIYGIAVIVAPTVGPTIGGWITDNYSWHWIFFINVPFGILSLILVQWLVVEPEVLERERGERLAGGLKIDWVGFVLIALIFGSLEFVLDRGQIEDWFQSTMIVIFATISACSFIFFIPWELTHDDPIVDIRLLCQRQFGHGVHGDAGGRRHAVRLEPDHAATDADELSLHGDAVRPGHDAGRPRDAGDDAARRPDRRPRAAEILDRDRLYHHRAGDVVFDLARARCKLQLLRDNARISDGRHAVHVHSDQHGRLYRTASAKDRAGSALINVARNLGGSIGVSLANTELVQRSQYHQARLVENLTLVARVPIGYEQFDAILHANWPARRRAGPGIRLHGPIGRPSSGAHGLHRHILQLVYFRRSAGAGRSVADLVHRTGERRPSRSGALTLAAIKKKKGGEVAVR